MIGGDASAAASDDSAQPVVAEELRQPAEPGQELARELAAIQSVILRNMRELSALIHDGNDPRMARAAGEPRLDAASGHASQLDIDSVFA